MQISFISDTHNKHYRIEDNLPGGDLIICAGDISSMGYYNEIKSFCEWFEKLPYTEKIFIAGNHDFGFEDSPEKAKEIYSEYNVNYLQDDLFIFGDYPGLKIYGSPWQPEFFDWAFNLPRNGEELKEKWENIPIDTDILITHGPPWGHLDNIRGRTENLGCELLRQRVDLIKPKIHVFGHIHSGYGYKFENGTHFINASVLNEQYMYKQQPVSIIWDQKENKLNFISK